MLSIVPPSIVTSVLLKCPIVPLVPELPSGPIAPLRLVICAFVIVEFEEVNVAASTAVSLNFRPVGPPLPS